MKRLLLFFTLLVFSQNILGQKKTYIFQYDYKKYLPALFRVRLQSNRPGSLTRYYYSFYMNSTHEISAKTDKEERQLFGTKAIYGVGNRRIAYESIKEIEGNFLNFTSTITLRRMRLIDDIPKFYRCRSRTIIYSHAFPYATPNMFKRAFRNRTMVRATKNYSQTYYRCSEGFSGHTILVELEPLEQLNSENRIHKETECKPVTVKVAEKIFSEESEEYKIKLKYSVKYSYTKNGQKVNGELLPFALRRPTFRFKMSDIPGLEIGKRVTLTVSYVNRAPKGKESSSITYNFIGCSPKLVGNPTPIATSCSSSVDGGVNLYFNKDVAPGYKMRYFIYQGDRNKFDRNKLKTKKLKNGENKLVGIQAVKDATVTLKKEGSKYLGAYVGLPKHKGTYFIVYQELSNNGSTVKSGEITPNFTVGGPTPVVLRPATNITQPICRNGKGTVRLSAYGGRGLTNLEYNYSKGNANNFASGTWQTSNTFSNLQQGVTYYFKARKRNAPRRTDCESNTTSATIKRVTNAVQITSALANSQAFTTTSTEGSIRVFPRGGTKPYTIKATKRNSRFSKTISNIRSTSAVINGLYSGQYNITITDKNGCSFTYNRTVTVNYIPPASIRRPVTTPIKCRDQKGTLQATISAYYYRWYKKGKRGFTRYTNNVTPPRSGLIKLENAPFGQYELRVAPSVAGANASQIFTQAKYSKLVKKQAFTLVNPILVSITGKPVVKNISCKGAADGSITINPSGGTRYKYKLEKKGTSSNWIPLPSNKRIPVASGGYYKLYIRNQNNCEYTHSKEILVDEPEDSLVFEDTSVTPVTTYNGKNGRIKLTISGGYENTYSYLWTGPNKFTATTKNISKLVSGDYKVIITDKEGCSITQTFYVAQPNQINRVAKSDVNCNKGSDGAITVTLNNDTNGTAFTYTWNDNKTGHARTGLTAGTYTVTITGNIPSATGPKAVNETQTFTITQPDALTFDGEPTITNNTEYLGAIGAIKNIAVKGGGSQSYTYQWKGPKGFTATTKDIDALPSGDYTITVRDTKTQCNEAISKTFYVKQPNKFTKKDAFPPNCNNGCGGRIEVELNDDSKDTTQSYTYTWDDNNATGATRTGLCAGTYTVTVTGSKNGIAQHTFTLENPDEFQLILPKLLDDVDNGILEQSWTPTSKNGKIQINSLNGVAPLTYIVKDDKGDKVYEQKVDTTKPHIIVGMVAGTYEISVRDSKGCNATVSITLPHLQIPVLDTLTQKDPVCYNHATGNISFNINNPDKFHYRWYKNGQSYKGDSFTLNQLSFGNYVLEACPIIKDKQPFSVPESIVTSKTITLQNPKEVTLAFVGKKDITCFDAKNGSITLETNGGTSYQYSINNGKKWQTLVNNTIPILKAGKYTVMVRNEYECVSSQVVENITIKEPEDILIEDAIQNVTSFEGEDGAISIQVKGGTPFENQNKYTFTWTADNGYTANTKNIKKLKTGNYTLVVTDKNGCNATKSFFVKQPDLIDAIIIKPTCYDGCDAIISLDVNQGNGVPVYQWKDGTVGKERKNLCPGTYNVTISNLPSNRVLERSYIVPNTSQIGPKIPVEKTFCKNQTKRFTIEHTDDSLSYLWTGTNGFTQKGKKVKFPKTGTYQLLITNKKGCQRTQQIQIKQSQKDIIAKFAMSTYGYINQEQLIVNISHPYPEKTEWILPQEATIVKNTKEEVLLKFAKEGTYTVALKTTTGDCVEYSEKKVIITKKEVQNTKETAGENTAKIKNRIKNVKIYPNPNSGNFNVDVELTKKGYLNAKIYQLSNGNIIAQQKLKNSKEHNLKFNINNVASGIYIMAIESPYGNSVHKIIMK